MAFDHVSELYVGIKPLPLEGVAPAFKEAPCPSLGLVIPQLPERLFQEVGDVEPLVGLEQLA